MRIGIDIDDTISDTYEVLFNYAQKYTVEELKKEINITPKKAYYDHNYTESIHGWNEEEAIGFWKKYYENMLKEVKPKTFAKTYIDKLAKNNEIYLITARFEVESLDIRKLTEVWLKKYQIPYNKLIINANDKAKIARENGIELFIDDSFENCKGVSNEGIRTFLMDSKANASIDVSDEKFERVYSWPHLYQEINLK